MGWGGVGGCMGDFNVYSRSISPKGRNVLTCVADLGGTSGPDLELDNYNATYVNLKLSIRIY